MSALAKSEFAPWSLSEAVVSDLVRRGAHLFDDLLDPKACAELVAEIRAVRRFDESLFLAEGETVDASPPPHSPVRNLLARMEPRLGFVERAPQIVEALWSLLGPDYRILDRRAVCELPPRALPDWLRRRAHGDPTCSLSAFVRPEHRDMAYAYGVDFHQDLLADPERPADFVTLYVYLHPVAETDAPLHLLEGSHRLGAQAFPHDLKRTGPQAFRCRDDRLGDIYVTERVLTGETGQVALWHACTLNGAPPATGDQPRISLRYRVARGEATAAGLDAVNATLAGALSLADAGPTPVRAVSDAPRWNGVLRA